jgi:hypothetical protein
MSDNDNENAKLVKILNGSLKLTKQIDRLLELKKNTVTWKDIPKTNRKEIDATVWNHLGLYYNSNKMFSNAIKVYKHMLDTIAEIEAKEGIEIHREPLYTIWV